MILNDPADGKIIDANAAAADLERRSAANFTPGGYAGMTMGGAQRKAVFHHELAVFTRQAVSGARKVAAER